MRRGGRKGCQTRVRRRQSARHPVRNGVDAGVPMWRIVAAAPSECLWYAESSATLNTRRSSPGAPILGRGPDAQTTAKARKYRSSLDAASPLRKAPDRRRQRLASRRGGQAENRARHAKPAAVRDMSPACTWPSRGRNRRRSAAPSSQSLHVEPVEFLLAQNAAEYFFDHAPISG